MHNLLAVYLLGDLLLQSQIGDVGQGQHIWGLRGAMCVIYYFCDTLILFRGQSTSGTRTDRFAVQIETVSRNLRAGTTSVLPESGRLGSSRSLRSSLCRSDPIRSLSSGSCLTCSHAQVACHSPALSLPLPVRQAMCVCLSPCHWSLISERYAVPLALAAPDGTPFS